ncbi:MAG: hypothetical protein ABIQ77_01105 [Anaerolineales bacterium]
MKKFYFPISLAALLVIGCGGLTFLKQPSPNDVAEATWTASPPPWPTLIDLASQTAIATDTATVSPSPTLIPTSTFTPTQTPIPPWIMQGPNEVIVPIFLYHPSKRKSLLHFTI